jgi:paired amphipathic helix protein Sin3a
MYLKSLDHMGIHVKGADKKLFGTKNIIEQIKAVQEVQRRQRSLEGVAPLYQFAHDFSDEEVLRDAVRLAIIYINNSASHSIAESDKIGSFIETFIPTFFSLSAQSIADRLKDVSRESVEEDAEETAQAELSNGRGRRVNGKKTDLLRSTLDRGRNGTKGRGQKEESVASGSKESTPDISSGVDDAEDQHDGGDRLPEVTNEKWLATDPQPAAVDGSPPLSPQEERELKADLPFRRAQYNMFANSTILVFFTMFEHLYSRLKALKNSEKDVRDEVARDKAPKPAKDIGLVEERPDYFINDGTSYYSQTLSFIENYLDGQHDETTFQDFLRHYYLRKGWALYTIHDLLKVLCRAAGTCAGNDSKDKTSDIIRLFYTNREVEHITWATEITYRKSVEKTIKEGEMYHIKWVSLWYLYH